MRKKGSPTLVAVVPVLLAVLAVAVPSAAAPVPTPPANDNFANAAVISHVPFHWRGNTTNATTEGGDPVSCGSGPYGQTVWFQFTPDADMSLEADTAGSKQSGGNYDTVLWVGTYNGSFNEVACNDDSSVDPKNGNASQVTFSATAGTTYYFEVGSYGGNVYPDAILKFKVTKQ